jgi:hypothetical protein
VVCRIKVAGGDDRIRVDIVAESPDLTSNFHTLGRLFYLSQSAASLLSALRHPKP